MKLRPHFAAYLALIAVFGLTSCGTRYYSATVSGYVKDASFGTAGNATGAGNAAGGGAAAPATNGGINDAEIRIYLTDPSVAGATYLVKSATASSGGNNGFWSHKITWETSSPKFSDTGDSGTVWIQVQRMGYFPKTVKVTGVLSDSTNLVPTIEMTLIKTTEVRGKVVNEKGNAINGVNVVLDLGSTTANDADFTVATASVDGEDGVYVFKDVPWNDADSIPAVTKALTTDAAGVTTASETITLYVNDANYYCDDANHDNFASLTKDNSKFVLGITSGAKTTVADSLVVRSVAFSIPELRGRVLDAANTAYGLNGVQVSVHIPAANANADPNVTTATVDSDGWFVFNNLRWTNVHPHRSATGVYDDQTPAQIYVSGANFYSDNDATAPKSITLVSDTSLNLSTATPVVSLTAGKATFKKGSIRGRIVLSGGALAIDWTGGRNPATGVNGVSVALNLADSNANPAYATTSGTSTVGSTSTDGMFEFKNVTWTNNKPVWSDSTKTTSTENIQVFVNDNNYISQNGATSPYVATITSDPATGTATPVTLASAQPVKRTTFTVPKVTGTVVSHADNTKKISNVTVALTLKSVTGNNNNQATVTTDKNGVFTFTNIGWTNNTPSSSGSDTISATLQVSDNNYQTAVPIADVSLTSGSPLDLTASPTEVNRTTAWTFTTTIQGTVQHQVNPTTVAASYSTVAGQQVVITPIAPDASVSITGGTLSLSTAANGTFTTGNITWTRDPSYIPTTAGQQNGGDTLMVSIAYPQMTGHTLTFATVTSFQVNSWQANNIAPTATDPDPANN